MRPIPAAWSLAPVVGVIILLWKYELTMTRMANTGMPIGIPGINKRSGWPRSIHKKWLFSGIRLAALGREMPFARSRSCSGVAAKARGMAQYMEINNGIWIMVGRQPANGLMPISWYSSICALASFSRFSLPLYLACIALYLGLVCNSCMARVLFICLALKG